MKNLPSNFDVYIKKIGLNMMVVGYFREVYYRSILLLNSDNVIRTRYVLLLITNTFRK